jgi:lysophospholipase L1-like esterase
VKQSGEKEMRSSQMPWPIFFSYLGYTMFSLLLAAAILEIGSGIVLSAYHRIRNGTEEGLTSPEYQGYPWAQAFWKEELLRRESSPKQGRYIPFLIWGNRPWHGKYINVDESAMGGLRRTVNPMNPACNEARRKVIWMFGGSTLFGLGVPDMETIPSNLSKELNSTGSGCFVILNAGMEGYLTNQELILLVELLKTGQRPDIVIFYDGVNDANAAVEPGIANAHLQFEFIKARVEGSFGSKFDWLRNSHSLELGKAIVARFRNGDSPAALPAEVEERAAAALDNYEANMRIVRSLGLAYNFEVFCFWQPSLATGGKPLTPFEQELQKDGNSLQILRAVNEVAARRALQTGSFVFLGQIFDSVKEPLYIDHLMHVGPRGNQIVAKAIAKRMESHAGN